MSSDKDISHDSKHNVLLHICEYQQNGRTLVETGLSREKTHCISFSGEIRLTLSRKETPHVIVECFCVCRCSDCCLMGCDTIDPEDGGNIFV
jgi:hypothetical protein